MPYSEIILSTHAFVPKDELKSDLDTLTETLTISSRYEENLKIELFKATPTHFGYPLYMRDYALYTDNLKDERTLGQKISLKMAPNFKLRDNQVPLIEKFLTQLEQGQTGWLINMPTGAGKTVCACRMLQAISKTTLIIVPRENLINQWKERLEEFTDLKDEDIGLAQQDVCDYQGKKVVLGMIHSLAKGKYGLDFQNYFGLVIWDEVHVAAAQTFSQTLSLFAPRYRIGMSATLARRDGLDDIYKWSIGQNLLSIDSHTLIQPLVFLLKYTTRKKNVRVDYISNAQHRRGMLISSLAKDDKRNELLAQIIPQIVATKRRTVVFSERKEQLKKLQEILLKDPTLDPTGISLFTGDTKEEDRPAILESSQVILATYGVMSMGIDVPNLRAVVFATPQSNIAQSVGRI
ncbi:MAG: DEAD/DEAH box helicase, partial [Desulfovibrionaceae bacterium]|nr:DEAD/DEAH box helicase [Desulfovibrionaceae bacterium]